VTCAAAAGKKKRRGRADEEAWDDSTVPGAPTPRSALPHSERPGAGPNAWPAGIAADAACHPYSCLSSVALGSATLEAGTTQPPHNAEWALAGASHNPLEGSMCKTLQYMISRQIAIVVVVIAVYSTG